ncbi:hypothetical protein [Lysinibacillus pakistanensis]|uniref:hypothetical protein n=1 Tax=Lysinibacillus pakistanensis TaxID=759811 RepID=UPI003D2A4A1E
MNKRHIQMLLHIPKNFTAQIQAGNEGKITYSINQASASMVKSMMESTAKQLTEEINHNIFPLKQEKSIEMFSQKFAQLPFRTKYGTTNYRFG